MAKGKTFLVGFTDEKAKWHNDGSSHKAKNGKTVKLPKRPLLPDKKGQAWKKEIFDELLRVGKGIVKRSVTKINRNQNLTAFDLLPDINQKLHGAFPKLIRNEILKLLNKGKSPVRRAREFKGYSDSYKKAINKGVYNGKSSPNKKDEPVTMRLTGKMHKSLNVEPASSRGIDAASKRLNRAIGFAKRLLK